MSNRISKETTVKGDVSALADTDLEEIELTEGITTYTYNALNQLITEVSDGATKAYAYDTNGNLIKQSGDKTVDYSYDKENHLIKATIQKGNSVTIESYTYDYAGNRTSKTVNESDTIYYVNDTSSDLSQVVAEVDEDGKEKTSYTRGDSAELLSMEQNGKAWYYLCDGHGSVRILTNEVGRITDRYSYDAYGSLLEKEGDTENEFLYTGEQYNANTGLYYLRARYMNPSTGTFISMDSYQGSIYDPVTLHKYLYANANPVMYTDPSGYSAACDHAVSTGIMSIIDEAWTKASMVALRIFSHFRATSCIDIIGITVCAKVTELVYDFIINKDIFSNYDLFFYVQCEILVGINSLIRVETKEDAQAYALEMVREKDKRKYLYYPAYAKYPGAIVSLRKGLTLEEARERVQFWGDVWAVDEAAAVGLCNALGGVSNEGATRDGNPENAIHYHAILSLGHRHIFFGIDKNLIFVP